MNSHDHLVFNGNHKYNRYMGGSIKKKSLYFVLTCKRQEAVDKRFQVIFTFFEG